MRKSYTFACQVDAHVSCAENTSFFDKNLVMYSQTSIEYYDLHLIESAALTCLVLSVWKTTAVHGKNHQLLVLQKYSDHAVKPPNQKR